MSYATDPRCKLALLLDETTGDYTDSSTTGATVTRPYGDGTMGATGAFGYGWSSTNLTGLDIDNSALNNFNKFTILFWKSGTDSNCYFVKGPNKVIKNNSGVYFDAMVVTDNTNARSFGNSLPGTGLSFFAVTYDDTGDRKLYLYKDGSQMSYTAQVAAIGTIAADSASHVQVSRGGVDPYYGSAGVYDEVAYFNDVLNTTEMTDIMTNGLASGGSSPVNATVTQLCQTLTLSVGTQTVNTGIFATVTQLCQSMSLSVGTQTVTSVSYGSVTQVCKALTLSVGTQTVNQLGDYTADANCQLALLCTEGTGTNVADSSGNNNYGTCAATDKPGWITTNLPIPYVVAAVDFHYSIDNIITVLNNAVLNFTGDCTMMCWVKLNRTDVHQTFINKSNSGTTNDYVFTFGNSALLMFMPAGNHTHPWYPGVDCWYHCVAVKIGTAGYLYLNGELFSTNANAYPNTNSGTTNNLELGHKNISGGENPLDGSLSEVAVFDRGLDASDIASIFAHGLTGAYNDTQAFTGYTQDSHCKLALLLDEIEYNFKDASPTKAWINKVGGTRNNTGQFGKSWRCSTSTSQLVIDNNAQDDFSEFTVVFWAKNNAGGPLFSKGTGSGTGKRIWNDSGVYLHFEVGAGTTNGQAIVGSGLGAGWVHCAFTFSNTGDRKPHIYFNLVEPSYVVQTAAVGTLGTDNASIIEIGTSYANGQTGSDVYFDEVAYFDRVLTIDEITDIKNYGLEYSSSVPATVTQVYQSLSLSVGTQVVASTQIVSITQVCQALALSAGTQQVSAVRIATVTQICRSLTLSTGTQQVSTGDAVPATVTQVCQALTLSTGTQQVSAVQNATVTQVCQALSLSVGTNSVNTGNVVDATVNQISAALTLSVGAQSVGNQINVTVFQTVATLTITGNTQAVTAVRNVSVAQIMQALILSAGHNILGVPLSEDINAMSTVSGTISNDSSIADSINLNSEIT